MFTHDIDKFQAQYVVHASRINDSSNWERDSVRKLSELEAREKKNKEKKQVSE